MADDPTNDIVGKIEDAVDDAPLPDHDIRPPWVDEVIEAIESIPDAIKEALPAPIPDPELPGDNDDPKPADDAPTDPDPEPDESPVPMPWTHKSLFK